MSRIPSERECVRILEEEGCGAEVIQHCCLVMRGAVEVVRACGGDAHLAAAGALLHDVGRARDHGIGHLLEGVCIARRRGMPPAVLRIIQRHVGAGLDREDVRELNLPPGDYLPETLEEKVIAQCDNLIEDGVRSVEEVAREMRERGYARAADRALRLHHEISELLGEDLSRFLSKVDLHSVTGPCSAYTYRP